MISLVVAAALAAAPGAARSEAGGLPVPREGEPAEPQPATEAQPAPPETPEGRQTPAGRIALPDISVIGRLAAVYYRRDVAAESPRDESLVGPAGEVKPLFQELELGLQWVVDRYARADVFLSFGAEAVEVAEAYLTTLSLPAGLQLRAGKLKSPFGRLNPQHAHLWAFVDRPLALVRILGPEGIAGLGADLAWLAPVPWVARLHLAWQEVAPGLAGELESTGLARLEQVFDLAEGATLGVGLSGALRLSALGGSKNLSGADLFLEIGRPRGRARVTLQAEVLAHNLGAAGAGEQLAGYGQVTWRSSPRWLFGARYDDGPALGGGRERRWSALAGFLPSELQRIRLQLSWDRLPGGRDGPEALLHLEFAIGAHGAHPF